MEMLITLISEILAHPSVKSYQFIKKLFGAGEHFPAQ